MTAMAQSCVDNCSDTRTHKPTDGKDDTQRTHTSSYIAKLAINKTKACQILHTEKFHRGAELQANRTNTC
jgi:hypothetical protein